MRSEVNATINKQIIWSIPLSPGYGEFAYGGNAVESRLWNLRRWQSIRYIVAALSTCLTVSPSLVNISVSQL